MEALLSETSTCEGHLKHTATKAEKRGETLNHTLRPGVNATPEFTGVDGTLRIHQGSTRNSSRAWNSLLCGRGTAYLGLRAHLPHIPEAQISNI